MTTSRLAPIRCEQLEGRALLSSLSQDIGQLVQDLGDIHQASNVTPAEVRAVGSDFLAIAKVATRPDPDTVAALKSELISVAQSGTITPRDVLTIEKDVQAVLASANIPTSLTQQAASDIKVVITASGITKADVTTITDDVRAIVTDLQALKK